MKTIYNEKKQQKIQQYQKEYQKKYRKKNAEKFREYLKNYYSKNKDRYRKYREKYKEQEVEFSINNVNPTKKQSHRNSNAYLEWQARERYAESIRKANERWLAQSVDINTRKI